MSAYSDLILAETSLQSYWRLNEAPGSGTVADSKGSVTGTVTAADVTLGATGLIANDPTDTCAQVTGSTAPGTMAFGAVYPFTGTANFSFEAWINPAAAALTNNGYVVWNTTAADGWALRLLSAGAVRFMRIGSSVTDQAQTANSLIVAGTTYHLVGTYDGSTLLIYINGIERGTLPATRTIGNPSTTFTVGEALGGGNSAVGFIDEVAVYNDDLSAASVLDHYETGIADPSVPSAAVRQYMRFVGPEQLGTSAADLYTVPAGTRITIRNLYVNNPSGSEIEFTLSVGNDAAGTRLLDQHAVPANDSYASRRATHHALEAGEKIQGFADAATTVVVIDGFIEAL